MTESSNAQTGKSSNAETGSTALAVALGFNEAFGKLAVAAYPYADEALAVAVQAEAEALSLGLAPVGLAASVAYGAPANGTTGGRNRRGELFSRRGWGNDNYWGHRK